MTVSSMLWATNGIGDGTATGYTDVQTQRFFRQLLIDDPTLQGVIGGTDNELAPSASDTSEITVGTGAALVYGLHVYSDAATVLTLPSVAADTGGIVYVEIDWVTQLAQINVNQNTSGNTAIPSLTQTALTKWQIPICSYVVDSSGDIWTDASKATAGVLDIRSFVITPLAGMVKLRTFNGDGSTLCSFTGIPQNLTTLIIRGIVRAASAGSVVNTVVTLNGDTGNNYGRSTVFNANATLTGAQVTAQSNILIGGVSGNSAPANAMDQLEITIANYTSALYKTIQSHLSRVGDGTTGSSGYSNVIADGFWLDTTAINRIDIGPAIGTAFAAGTVLTLYGVR